MECATYVGAKLSTAYALRAHRFPCTYIPLLVLFIDVVYY